MISKLISAVLLAVTFLTGVHAQPLPEASPESVGMSSERLGRLGAAINREIQNGNMPGAVVAVARHGRLVYFEALGYLDKEAGIGMPKDAIFSIASMTKPIFAAAAMALYERGDLLLDVPIGHYLPRLDDLRVGVDGDVFQTVPAIRQPTIRDLMRHTSGYPGGGGDSAITDRVSRLFPDGDLDPALTGDDVIEILSDIPLEHQPGTQWDYSLGFDLLAIIFERITGERASVLVGDEILKPLGMRDTYFRIPSSKADRKAKPLPVDPITGAKQSVRNHFIDRGIDCGGNCLTSTASDYLSFAQMLLNRGTLNGVRVLGPKTVEYMTSDHVASGVNLSRLHNLATTHTEGFGFGLSVAVRRGSGGGGAIGSPGTFLWAGGSGPAFWVDPEEQLVIVYMAEVPGAARGSYREMIPALVYQAILD